MDRGLCSSPTLTAYVPATRPNGQKRREVQVRITAVKGLQVALGDPGQPLSAFVRVEGEDGAFGMGEASPMSNGTASLGVLQRDIAPKVVGSNLFDHAVTVETLTQNLIKLGHNSIVSAAIAALDIALWDLKGKVLGQPIYKLLGGAWRTKLPLYSSLGGNAGRSVDEVVRAVARRIECEKPEAVKLRLNAPRTKLDVDIPGDLAKARAVRDLVGDDFRLGFDANSAYSFGGALRVGRELEQLGYEWFEEPLPPYHVATLGELAKRLSIVVSAGEQTYSLQGVKELIEAGVRMVQPDVIKMGGITGLMQCSALCMAHGVELVPHQTQPTLGHLANLHVVATIMHSTKPVELADAWERGDSVFNNPSRSVDGHFTLPQGPGLGAELDFGALGERTVSMN
ncbi:MAG: mandelate racemase/muconate lactonizing enzyme family protein [Alphaproteobacteria bacterium]|nr:MAG: mandelate racemase/muconate lactonizing enzyme family protein [Alphaproteobacteria bacterium]